MTPTFAMQHPTGSDLDLKLKVLDPSSQLTLIKTVTDNGGQQSFYQDTDASPEDSMRVVVRAQSPIAGSNDAVARYSVKVNGITNVTMDDDSVLRLPWDAGIYVNVPGGTIRDATGVRAVLDQLFGLTFATLTTTDGYPETDSLSLLAFGKTDFLLG